MITRGIDPQRIEALHLRCTQPVEELAYDGWLVRRAPNDVKRARSVNAVHASTKPMAEKIEHCERLYAEAGLPPLFRITPFAPASLNADLAARGYERIDHTLQQVATLDHPLRWPDAGVRVGALALQGWLPIAGTMRTITAETQAAELRRLEHSPLPLTGALAYAGATPVACGLMALDGVFAAPMDIFVAEAWRGRGIGTAITGWLLEHARANGAGTAWLNVLADNAPALRIYAKLGFRTLYEYWYRVKPLATS